MKQTPEESALLILERLGEGALWQPDGIGLSYIKSDVKTVKLISQEDNSSSSNARIRMKNLIEKVGWTVDESEVRIKEIPKFSLSEQYIITQFTTCQEWSCICDRPISSFSLNRGLWVQDDKYQTVYDEDGENTTVLWSVVVTCPSCGMKIPLTPLQFGLQLTVKYSEV